MSKPLRSATTKPKHFHVVNENDEIFVDRLQLTISRKYTYLLIYAFVKNLHNEQKIGAANS